MIKKNKDELNEMEYLVTQENGTESPFQNEYWNHFDKGIYVDKLSGKPLFTSEEKFESNCGWPSFSKALNDDEIIELVDKSFGMIRTEVRSEDANSHLGHVFMTVRRKPVVYAIVLIQQLFNLFHMKS